MEHKQFFHPVELFEAELVRVSGNHCLVFIQRLGQTVNLSLPSDRHGDLKCGHLLSTFYKPEELEKNLTPAPLVQVEDKILLHFSPDNEIIRWQRSPEEAVRRRA